MQTKRSPLPRRRPVPRHPGIYYRPKPGGKVQPPYEITYLDGGGARRWTVVHGTLADAEAKRAELRLRRRRGERIQPTRQTFAEYSTEWLGRQHARPRTLESYRWALTHHLIPRLGRRRLDQITCDDIANLIAALRRQGLKGWTITSALRPLSMILAQAARRGHIPVNPISQLERGERPKHDDQRPKRILTLEEMQALLSAADSEQYRCLLELLLTAGLRIGEALGLCVADLDRQHSLLRVECQLDRDGNRTALKTAESRRTLDIPSALMRRLLALVAERGQLFNPQALVFASHNQTGLQRKVAREALKRASKQARLAAPEPTLHDLRHSHASMLIALDVPLVEVQLRARASQARHHPTDLRPPMERTRSTPQPDRPTALTTLRPAACPPRSTTRAPGSAAASTHRPASPKGGAMTVQELIDLLQEHEPEAEVRFLAQPSWPFEYTLSAVVEADDQPADLSGYRETPAARVLLVEGRQACYGGKHHFGSAGGFDA